LTDFLIELSLLLLNFALPFVELFAGRLAVDVVSDRFPSPSGRKMGSRLGTVVRRDRADG
jgi:hypothetical protein